MADPQSDAVRVPTLVMTGGPLDGTTYPLTVTARELVVGSDMGADVQIMLGNVEPQHASLSLGSRGLAIADAGSATGTFVNGEKVEGVQTLQDGDRICLGPPGAKGSAKLLVRLPGASAMAAGGAPAGGAGPDASPFGAEAAPLVIDDSEGPPLILEGDSPPESPPPTRAPAPASPPPGDALELDGEQILAAEEVVADDGTEGPPLEASEVPPGDDAGGLFDSPLPPSPPVPPAAAPPSPEPGAPRPAGDSTPLTAPPLPEDYQTEPPSIPFAPSDEPEPEPVPEPAPPPPRPPAPSRARAPSRGRRTGRRSRGPQVPIVPIAGGLVVVLGIGAAVWWFLRRPSAPEPSPAPPAAATAVPAAAAVPPGTPQVTALEPDVAMPGESVLIRGAHLSPPVSVTVAGTPAAVTETTEEAIRVVLPDLGLRPGQKTELVVQAGGTTMAPMDFFIGRLPLVLGLSPARGPVGERVVITGRGFAPDPAGNAVTFGGAPGLVLTASATELTVVTPAVRAAESPEIPVVVTAGGRASAADVRYALTRTATSAFVPRFFAAPVTQYPGEPLAFVSTPLAPVLLLGGPGQGESTAMRAANVSAALNRLVEAAATRKVEIEFRPGPSPSVAVAGEVDPFLVADPEDAAAYSRAWAGARSRVGTRALAQHWAALLQDYFGLFVYRERPLRMRALSPRGQVFLDIYAAARRRGRGRGVPTSIVYPPTEKMATALTQAALVVSDRAPREEIAIGGRWQGTIQDPDRGDRRFNVEFRVEDAGVTGSMTTWRGSIQVSSPLRDISFSRGTLKFTADLQGTPHRFEGVLEEETITGAAKREGLAPAPFTLQFVQ